MKTHLLVLVVVVVLTSGAFGLAQNASAGQLPVNLIQFREIPQVYRTAVWSVLSPEARSTIMRETFQAVIDTGKLTAEQVEVLRVDIARLTPQYYAECDRINNELQSKAKANGGKFEDRSDPLFLKDMERAMTVRRALGEYVGLLSPFQLPQLCPKVCEAR